MAQTLFSSAFKLTALLSSILFMSACGGGGGSNDTATAETNAVQPTEPSTPSIPPSTATLPSNECTVNSLSCDTRTKQTIPEIYIRSMIVENHYDLQLKSSENLSVSIQSLSPTICSVSGIEVQALNSGSCTLAFSQAGNTTIAAATSVNKTIPVYTVAQAPKTNIGNCQAGVLTDEHKNQALNTLNHIRSLHGLKPVVYDYTHDDEMMQAALITAASKPLNLTHYPKKTTPCYSEVGDLGSQTSNLGMRWGNPSMTIDSNNIVVGAMTELYSVSIGHRRWLLNPFLNKVAVGAVLNPNSPYVEGTAMKVLYPEDYQKTTSNTTGLIAYPYHDYPAKYFAKGVPLSMSIFYDQKGLWNNGNVDYTQATVQVTERTSGTAQTISKLAFDNDGSGLPNSIQFNFDTLSYNTTYDVKISNVKVKGVTQNYTYWFKVTQ